MKPAMIYETM